MTARRGTPRRVDANHVEIVNAIRATGCAVLDLSAVGGGVPDLLVQCRDGSLILIEVKVDKGKLNKRQQAWHDAWRGTRPLIIRSVDEALAAIGVHAD